ncbi:hypothetical protein [Sphingobacterium sp. LRF_L2]|uniref:hypothetical protein n=1 Tax=Sphingobacterium sp. LRF_L2 TaxID=3369421 RepID=UPI003F616D47
MRALNISLFFAALTTVLYSSGKQYEQVLGHDSSILQHNQKNFAGEDTIILEAFKIIDSDSEKVILSMDKDGKCYLFNDFIGSITSSGEMKSDDGTLVARLNVDKFTDDKDTLLVIINKDGSISGVTEKDMTWGSDGILTNSETGLKVTPVATKARQAASMLLCAFMGFSITESEKQ